MKQTNCVDIINRLYLDTNSNNTTQSAKTHSVCQVKSHLFIYSAFHNTDYIKAALQ